MRKATLTIARNELVNLKMSRPTHRLSSYSLANVPLGFPLHQACETYYTILLQETDEADEMSLQRLLLSWHALQWVPYPFPYDSRGLSADDAVALGNSNLDTFTSLEQNIFKKALIEHVHWVDARTASDLQQSGCLFTWARRQMTEPTWQGSKTEKWRKELILLGDQTTDC